MSTAAISREQADQVASAHLGRPPSSFEASACYVLGQLVDAEALGKLLARARWTGDGYPQFVEASVPCLQPWSISGMGALSRLIRTAILEKVDVSVSPLSPTHLRVVIGVMP